MDIVQNIEPEMDVRRLALGLAVHLKQTASVVSSDEHTLPIWLQGKSSNHFSKEVGPRHKERSDW